MEQQQQPQQQQQDNNKKAAPPAAPREQGQVEDELPRPGQPQTPPPPAVPAGQDGEQSLVVENHLPASPPFVEDEVAPDEDQLLPACQCPHNRQSPTLRRRMEANQDDEDDDQDVSRRKRMVEAARPLMGQGQEDEDEEDESSMKASLPQSRVDSLASDATFCPVCSDTHVRSQEQRADDTDSFTPRVRSDKKSVTVLLGKLVRG